MNHIFGGSIMGAWNYTVFDDDTAYDALDALMASSDIVADMEGYFNAVIEAEYVGYEEGHYALVSAAVMDSVLNEMQHRCDDEDYFEWIKTLKQFNFTPLRKKAVMAIGAVLSGSSELKELWEENEKLYPSWREDKLSIQERLR